MNISFSGKVPIAKCQIQNLKTKNFEPAYIYEIDCKDRSDIDTLIVPENEWRYAKYIQRNLADSMMNEAIYGEPRKSSYYVLENKDGETLGMSEVSKSFNNTYDLTYLDTKKQKPYKYVGQTLLATVAREALKKGTELFTIYGAALSALDFYVEKCGFKDAGLFIPIMQKEEIPAFVKRTEDRTKARIIDYNL